MTSTTELIKQRRLKLATSASPPRTVSPVPELEAQESGRTYDFTVHEAAQPWMEDITAAEERHKLPRNLLPRLIEAESYFNPKAKSPTGATGIAQIMPKYHPTVDPTDPKASIDYAGKHLRELYDEFGDWDKAIAAYNWGAKGVRAGGLKNLPKETREYLERINKGVVQLGPTPIKIEAPPKPTTTTSLIKARREKLGVPEVQLPVEAFEDAEEKERELPSAEEFYSSKAAFGGPSLIWHPATSALMAKGGYGVQPRGQIKLDEFGRPVDENGKPYWLEKPVDPEKIGNFLAVMFKGFSRLASQPMEVIKGGISFVSQFPAFAVAIPAAVGTFASKVLEQAAFTGKEDVDFYGEKVKMHVPRINFKEAYMDASKSMAEALEVYGKAIGLDQPMWKPTHTSELAQQVTMAPLIAMTTTAQKVSSMGVFEGHENAQGLILVAGDMLGFILNGALLHPRRSADFVRKTEQFTADAGRLADKINEIKNMPEDIAKSIELKKVEIEKQRMEAVAKKYAEQFAEDMTIVEQMAIQAERDAKARLRPTADTGIASRAPEGVTPEFQFESKKGNKYYKIGDKWYTEGGTEVTNPYRKGAIEKNKKPYTEQIEPDEGTKRAEEAAEYDKLEVIEGKKVPPKDEGTHPLDMPDKHVLDPDINELIKADPSKYKATVLTNRYGVTMERPDGQPVYRVRGPGLPEQGASASGSQLDFVGIPKPEVKGKVTKMKPKPSPAPKFKPGDKVMAYGEGISDQVFDLWDMIADVPERLTKGQSYAPYIDKLRKFVKAEWGQEGLDFFNKDLLEQKAKYESMGESPYAIADPYAFQHTINKFGMPKKLKPKKPRRGQVIDIHGTDIVKDVDKATGSITPEDRIPVNYYTNKKKTFELAKVFDERLSELGEKVLENPETRLQKLINDVNRWKHGDNRIDIEVVRDALSRLASEAEELRNKLDSEGNPHFLTSVDHLQFMETARSSAAWAKTVERGGKKPTPGVQLNMMIPLEDMPDIVRDILSTMKDVLAEGKKIRLGDAIPFWSREGKLEAARVKDVYRNEQLFRRTGFWYGRDGKWRFEVPDLGAAKSMETQRSLKRALKKAKNRPYRTTVGDILNHPDLYRAVPEVKYMKVEFDDISPLNGKFENNIFKLNSKAGIRQNISTIFHEIQHYVNERVGAFEGSNTYVEEANVIGRRLEQLAMELKTKDKSMEEVSRDALQAAANFIYEEKGVGGNVRWFYDTFLPFLTENAKRIGIGERDLERLRFPIGAKEKYFRVPGEMEARLASYRATMTPEQLAKELPWQSLDKMLEKEGRTKAVAQHLGTTLYSGLPIDQAALKVIEAGRNVSRYVRAARGAKKIVPEVAAEAVKREFNRSFIDRSGNIRVDLLNALDDFGYKVIQAMYLSKGASSRAAKMLKQMGREVYSGLTSNEKVVLDTLILTLRLLDISKYKNPKQFKLPKDVTLEGLLAYEAMMETLEGITPEQGALIRQRAGAYFDWMKKPLKDLLDSGIIDQAFYDKLIVHDYRRIESIKNIYDHVNRPKLGGKKRTVYDSGIESLSRGKDTDIYEPSSEIMALEVYNRTYGRVMNNDANMMLLQMAREFPDNPFVRVRSKEQGIPPDWARIYVYEKGQRKPIHLNPEFANEWVTNSPEISYKLGQLLRYASGSPVLRTFATGINWGFALANLPRDVMHAWFAARTFKNGNWRSVYSSHAPVAAAELTRDFSSIFSDAVTRGKRYEDYIDEGGGMEFLVHQGRLFQRGKHIRGPLDPVFDFMGYFGETSEIMTRLAIRERVIRTKAREHGISMEEARKNKEITKEATFAARDYMDFGQGGGIAKVLDNGLPYLNASIQGSRGLFRAFKPGSGTALASTYKLAQFATVVTGTYLAATNRAPETMKNLVGNVDMENNLCIPLGDDFGFMDERGDMRYIYLKIPLDPGQKFFKVFFEASADKWLGKPIDVDRVVDSLKEYSPVGVTEMPPTSSAVLGYFTNKDFWLNEDIWTKTDRPYTWPESAGEVIPGKTPQAYQDFGKLTGLSPERTKYAVEELLTTDNVFAYLLGKGYDEMLGKLPKSQKAQHLAMVLKDMPAVHRFIGVTNPYSKHAGMISEAKQQSDMKTYFENSTMDLAIEQYLYQDTKTKAEVAAYAKSFKDKDTYDRLMDRFKWEVAIKNLPEKSFWRRMKGLDTEAKAKVFVERLNAATPEEKDRLWKEYAIIDRAKGVVSDSFRQEVRRIKAEQQTKR